MTSQSKTPNTLAPQGVFFLLGASGSGKGTLANTLLENKQIDAHLSMGDLLRARQDDLNLEAELRGEIPNGFSSRSAFLSHAVRTGLLIPDAWTQSIVKKELAHISPKLLWAFDGYPRSPAAATHLLEVLRQQQISCLGVVHLELDSLEMQRRLLARGRADDTKTGITNRYQFYLNSVLPSLKELQKSIPILELNASLEPRVLANAVWDWLNHPPRPV
jgi:adenylate kinase